MPSRTLTLSAWSARRKPDEDLFERTLRGDPVAFSEVYRRYQKRIYGYCLARSLNPDAAADATQEVFMRLLRSDPGSINNPKPWLFKVARNVVIDVSRKQDRKPEDLGIDEDSLAWDQLRAADTADEALSRSDAKDVYLALRTLRPRYRTAIIMRDVHEQSAKDMADAFETTPGAVDTLVSRARDAFGAAYASVRNLPTACRASVELIYRSHGTGISDEERDALRTHLATCERCKAEAKRAEKPRHLAGLLPFLIPTKRFGYGIIDKATFALGSVPDAAMQTAPAVLSQPHTWNVATKVGAGLLAATIFAAPIAAVVNRTSDHAGRSDSTASAWSSSSSWGRASSAAGSTSSSMQHGIGISKAWSDAWNTGHDSSGSTWSSDSHHGGMTSSTSGGHTSSRTGTSSHTGSSSTSRSGSSSSDGTSHDSGPMSSGTTRHDGGTSWTDMSGSSTDGESHHW